MRRWLQFSLRTLLVATTLACVCLAAAYHYVEPWLADRAAAKAIAEAGGSCQMTPVGPDFMRSWFGPDVLQRISAVDLSQPETTAACLTILPRLGRLEKATLSGAKFTDEHLAAVGQLERLRELTLRGTTVSPEAADRLRVERRQLVLIIEPLTISWADLQFPRAKGQPFGRDQLTERIRCLDGSPVQVDGLGFPAVEGPASRQWYLAVFDDVPPSASSERYTPVLVTLRKPKRLPLVDSPLFMFEGTLRIDEFDDPMNGGRGVFQLKDAAEVRYRSPEAASVD